MKQEIDKSIPEKIIDEMISILKSSGNLSKNQIERLQKLYEEGELSKDKKVLEILYGGISDEAN